jgi:hypothetical protein
VDDQGRAYKRSQLQIQIAVNRHRDELEAKLLDTLPSLADLEPVLCWSSPLEEDRFREYWDGKLLERIGRPDLIPKLKNFWPVRGPHWDAIAIARSRDGDWLGPVLVEAKSHPGETRSSCGAENERRDWIERQLVETREWLGVPAEHEKWWMKGLYQAANRFTFLRWWREVLGERAWLVNIYVVEDPSDRQISTTKEQWIKAIERDSGRLGVSETDVAHSGVAFIVGRERAALLSPVNS